MPGRVRRLGMVMLPSYGDDDDSTSSLSSRDSVLAAGGGPGRGAAATAAAAQPELVNQLANNFKWLHEMGFNDNHQIVAALRASGGDVNGAVEILLQNRHVYGATRLGYFFVWAIESTCVEILKIEGTLMRSRLDGSLLPQGELRSGLSKFAEDTAERAPLRLTGLEIVSAGLYSHLGLQSAQARSTSSANNHLNSGLVNVKPKYQLTHQQQEENMEQIFDQLTNQQDKELDCSCLPLNGLKTKLQPHQCAGIRWMVQKEGRKLLSRCVARRGGMTARRFRPNSGSSSGIAAHQNRAKRDDEGVEFSEGGIEQGREEEEEEEDSATTANRKRNLQKNLARVLEDANADYNDNNDRDNDSKYNSAKDAKLGRSSSSSSSSSSRRSWVNVILTTYPTLAVDILSSINSTPVVNSLNDVHSVLRILKIDPFHRNKIWWDKSIGVPYKGGDHVALTRLRTLFKSIGLRRNKTILNMHNATRLPPKYIHLAKIQLNDHERRIYDSVIDHMRSWVSGLYRAGGEDAVISKYGQILGGLTRLKQICCDYHLVPVEHLARLMSDGLSVSERETLLSKLEKVFQQGGGFKAVYEDGEDIMCLVCFDPLLRENAKITKALVLLHRVQELMRDPEKVSKGQKCVVISQFTTFLDRLQRHLTDAGLNLTAANHVFLMDQWWNPAVDMQAIDRVHRLGQKRDVQVWKFVVKDSIEENILELQSVKQALTSGIHSRLSADELRKTRVKALLNIFGTNDVNE
eukprot:jgi/Bigna1/130065/aug1.10_g4773